MYCLGKNSTDISAISATFCISEMSNIDSIFWDQGHYHFIGQGLLEGGVYHTLKDEDEDLGVWGSEAWRVSNEALPK